MNRSVSRAHPNHRGRMILHALLARAEPALPAIARPAIPAPHMPLAAADATLRPARTWAARQRCSEPNHDTVTLKA